MDWTEDLEVCAEASKLDIHYLLSCFNGVVVDLKRSEATPSRMTPGVGDAFVVQLKQFLGDAQTTLSREADVFKEILASYVETNEYYGEDTRLLGELPGWVTSMVRTGETPENL